MAEEVSVSWEKRAMDVGYSTTQGKAFPLLQELVAMGEMWEERLEPLCPPCGAVPGLGKEEDAVGVVFPGLASGY